MANNEEDLEALSREVTHLEQALSGLPDSQEAQGGRIRQRIEEASRDIAEIRRRLNDPDAVSVDRSPFVDFEHRHLLFVMARYSGIAGVYGDLTVQGQAPRTTKRLTAAASHFIDLHHQVYRSLEHSSDDESDTTFRVDTFRELFRKIVGVSPRIALIGDPGSGKSTTLGRLAYEFARVAEEAGWGLIPVLLDLATVRLGESFEQALTASTLSALGSENKAVLRRDVVYIIDGLNETSHMVVGQIVGWLHDNPDARVIVACRKFDYLDRTLPLRRIDILPLDVGQINAFIGHFLQDEADQSRLFWGLAGSEANAVWRWFKRSDDLPTFENFWYGQVGTAYSYEIERKRISDLQAAVTLNTSLPGVLEVVRNPFLLYVAIIAYLNDENLPDSRTELLQAFAGIMLERGTWTGTGIYDTKSVANNRTVLNRAEELLQELAFEITQKGFSTGIEAESLRTLLLEIVSAPLVEEFLNEARRSGILEWSTATSATIRFRHQLIQEYFASIKLGKLVKSGSSADYFWPSANWWEVTPWDEVLLFLAGSMDDVTALVEWLTPVNPSLAYRCTQVPGVAVESFVLQMLYEPGPSSRSCPVARARWGRILSAAGDNRAGVGLDEAGMPDIVWVKVPPGTYDLGGDDSLRELGLFLPPTTVEITHEYYIAKYQVTYAQFGAFVTSGYRDDSFWTAEGLAWRGDQEHPRLWDEPQYAYSNHPVVGVTWFEAIAFAKWLSLTCQPLSSEGWEISLPTEAEWEVACRWPDGRKYAWGNKYLPGIANIDETYQGYNIGPYFLRHTTAVGLYERGKNALGAYDMCGNVWEWTLSKWDTPYLAADENSLVGYEHRVVRGNSWYNCVRFASAATHDCLDPDLGVNDTGLRLVRRRIS